MDWKAADHEYARDFAERVDAITPEPLYESPHLPSPKVCLVCAGAPASSALYSATKLIVPLCKDCSADWNFHGYDLLKRTKPQQLLLRLAKYKLFHPLTPPGVIEISRDVAELARWGKKMKAILASLKSADKS